MSTKEFDFNGEIKWMRMGNGSAYVDPRHTKEFKINNFINRFIELNKQDEEFLDTFDRLIRNKDTFVQRMHIIAKNRLLSTRSVTVESSNLHSGFN